MDKLKENTLASLQLLYDLAHIVKELHTKNRKLSLIHSNLFFLNTENKTLHYMDFLFDIVIDKIDKSSNFQIANFFGFFDMDFAESLENNETEYLSRSLPQNLKQSQYHSSQRCGLRQSNRRRRRNRNCFLRQHQRRRNGSRCRSGVYQRNRVCP